MRPGGSALGRISVLDLAIYRPGVRTHHGPLPGMTQHICVCVWGGGVHVPLTFWWGQDTGEHLTEGCRKLHWPGERWTFGIPGLRSELGWDKGCHSLWGGREKGREGTQRDLREVEGRDPRPRPVLGQ